MSIPELLDAGYKIVFIAGGFGTTVVFLKGGVRWLIDFKKKLEFIETQLKVNGGGSLRDAVNSLAREVVTLKKDVAALKEETTVVQTPILKEVAEAVKPNK